MQQTEHYSAAPTARRARPAWLPTLVTLLLLPLLIGLGFWQLDRAEQKRSLMADFVAAGEAIELASAAALAELDGLRRFERVSVRGRYLPPRQFLLDNMIYDGSAGYHVLTPFVTDSGPVIVVNRGWVARDYGGALPDVALGDESRRIEGRVARLPRPAIAVGDTSTDPGWPRVVHFPEADDLRAMLSGELEGRALAETVLLLDAADPDGFVRAWQPTGTGPERHMAYALQWFAFAATLAAIWLVMFIRRRRQAHD